MNIKEICDSKRYEDLFIISRFMYRIGRPIFPKDKIYDTLETSMINAKLLPEYTCRTYDDDPIPFELLKELGWLSLVPNLVETSRYSAQLDEEKSLSINAVRSIDEIWEFLRLAINEDISVSLKVDGVNSKILYILDYLELCLSRAREGNGFDYTKGIAKCIPTHLHTGEDDLKIFSETFVRESYLPELQKINPKIYKTPKSSAISLLLREHEDKHYKQLVSLAFNVEGPKNFKTVEDRFKFLEEQGFTTVPYKIIKREDIPKSREQLGKWIEDLCAKFWELSKDLSSDGIVLEINNLNWQDKVVGKYSNRNIAVKMFGWDTVKYIGIVKNIIVEQQRVEASCRIEIEPIKTYDSCSATFIQGYNPDILISQGINIGSTVEFERDSGAINKLVYTDKLNCF